MKPKRLKRTGAIRGWVILGAVILVAGGAVLVNKYGSSNEDYEVAFSEVGSGPVIMTVETVGTVEPLATITVGCETTGKIVEITVDHDDPVKKDQIICRIDPELVEAQHAQSAAELARAKSQLMDAEILKREQEANLPVATKRASGQLQDAQAALINEDFNWKKVQQLFKDGAASESEFTAVKASFERAQAAVKIAESAYEQAKLNEEYLPKRAAEAVVQAQAALKLAEAHFKVTETQLDRCIIRSPIDGVVLQRYQDVGTTVTAAFQTPPLFLIAQPLNRMRVLAKVSESDIVHIERGQVARFSVEGKQRMEFQGDIQHKRNQPEVVQGVATYTVILEVDNDERHTLLPGMSVNVEIECVNRTNAVRITNKALRFKPPLTLDERQAIIDTIQWPSEPKDAQGAAALYSKKAHLWQIDQGSGQWKIVPVWIGVTDNVNTEVLSGANPGDRVVREFIFKSAAPFGLKEAIRLARPDNRTL